MTSPTLGSPSSTPGTTVPGGGPGVATIPTPSGSVLSTVADPCCGSRVVGPDCQPPAFTAKECLPALVLEVCAGSEPQALFVTVKGAIFRETSGDCGNFTEDTTGECPSEAVPIWSADGALWARDTDGTLYKRNASTGAWTITDCGPVVEAGCVKCVVIELDEAGDATIYEHVRPTIADFRSDISSELCSIG